MTTKPAAGRNISVKIILFTNAHSATRDATGNSLQVPGFKAIILLVDAYLSVARSPQTPHTSVFSSVHTTFPFPVYG